jgi:precorrin-2 dehydrogenase / sirohydrochlorin ferrochelatase
MCPRGEFPAAWKAEEIEVEIMSSLFPMFLKLEGKRCLVVGAGKVGGPKIGGLLDTGALIDVIALEATEQVHGWANAGRIELKLRGFVPEDLDGASLAVVATGSPALDEFIYREAQRRKVFCNVVDVPEFCDFYYGAVVRRGDLQIAVSTNGNSPFLAQKIRQQLEKQFGLGYEHWVAELGATRKLIAASDLDAQRKRELLQSFASREAVNAALGQESANDSRKVTA